MANQQSDRGLASLLDDAGEDLEASGITLDGFGLLTVSAGGDSLDSPFWSSSWHSLGASSSINSGLILLDFESLAKGGPGGGGGGGGTGGGSATQPYTSGGNAANYNIEIIFKGSFTPDLRQTFIQSADLLSSYIKGDVANVFFRGKVIDDIQITAELATIDGVNGILGQAGPTAIRTANYLPAAGSMQFDVADADYYQGLGLFNDIVFHEMMHVLGFGTIWDYLNLVEGAGTPTPIFTGEAANDAYTGSGSIRVENDGGSGTALSHWDEETFANEIMTGYINPDNQLNFMTVASLADLGYELDPTLSGTYVPPTWI